MTRTEMISMMSEISKQLGNIIDRMIEAEVSDLKEQELDGISKFEKYICRQTLEAVKVNKQFIDTMLTNPTIDKAIKNNPWIE